MNARQALWKVDEWSHPWFSHALTAAFGLLLGLSTGRAIVHSALTRARGERAPRDARAPLPEFRALAEAIADLGRAASVDTLTGLPNRARTGSYLLSVVSSESQQELAVAMIDIDHFKAINDSHGHVVGDLVLKEVAERLRRGMDGGFIGRWGGEEFLAILPRADRSTALRIADTLRAGVAEGPVSIPGIGAIPVTCSVGVASAGPSDDDVGATIARADRALYLAKRTRNAVIAAE